MTTLPESVAILIKVVAKTIAGSHTVGRHGLIFLYSFLEHFVQGSLAVDINELKQNLQKVDGAESNQRVAGAAEDANRARVIRAEEKQKLADAEKTTSEARAIEKDAETRNQVAVARAKLDASISKLRQEGGDVLIDKDALLKSMEEMKKIIDENNLSK